MSNSVCQQRGYAENLYRISAVVRLHKFVRIP
jgi:hypothetical protein